MCIMKLEEQLFQVHFTEDSIPRIVNAKLTKKGIVSLENFAIGFSEWLVSSSVLKTEIPMDVKLKMYKNQKGL